MFAVYAKFKGRITREIIGLESSLEKAQSVANSWLRKRHGGEKSEFKPIDSWVEVAAESNAGGAEELAYCRADVKITIPGIGTGEVAVVIQSVAALI